ncbi:MAG: hypothetical protein Ta2F_07070 [Termitinemataceae bacterium]|nr:MAG: hypothetical protein Ta2F_07070 [Termitinemataceae bacterium]
MNNKINLSTTELAERVAIIKRFKELLISQRERFKQYLAVLDKQKDIIESGTAEDIISHVELEEKIVGDIFTIQKSLVPMQSMYKTVLKTESPESADIPLLSETLEKLKKTAALRSIRNKDLLEKRMVIIRNEMKSLRTGPLAKTRRSVYAAGEQPVLIDIKG